MSLKQKQSLRILNVQSLSPHRMKKAQAIRYNPQNFAQGGYRNVTPFDEQKLITLVKTRQSRLKAMNPSTEQRAMNTDFSPTKHMVFTHKSQVRFETKISAASKVQAVKDRLISLEDFLVEYIKL